MFGLVSERGIIGGTTRKALNLKNRAKSGPDSQLHAWGIKYMAPDNVVRLS